MKSFSLQVSHNTLSKLERKYPKKYYSIQEIKINDRILKINNKFSIYRLQKIVLADLSARLVRIADQFGDSPFDVVHCHLSQSFGIVVLWVIGRHSTASRNSSAMHRLPHFSANLIL